MLVFLQAPKRYQNGGTFGVHSESHKIFKCTLYLRQTDTNGVVHSTQTAVRVCSTRQEEANSTTSQAAPNELKLGEGG